MKDFVYAIRTNENGARTKLIVATAITVTTVGLGIYLTKKNSLPVVELTVVQPVVTEPIVEAVSETVAA
jgi:hypothetical protein